MMRAEAVRILITGAILSMAIANHAAAAGIAPQPRGAGAVRPGQERAESGVFGFAGAVKGGGAPSGVIGECVWIYDATNRKQVATGVCKEGNFRVGLKPGVYVVRGPGGNQKVDIKPNRWVKIKSLVALPAGF
jgi:hypothetical protein